MSANYSSLASRVSSLVDWVPLQLILAGYTSNLLEALTHSYINADTLAATQGATAVTLATVKTDTSGTTSVLLGLAARITLGAVVLLGRYGSLARLVYYRRLYILYYVSVTDDGSVVYSLEASSISMAGHGVGALLAQGIGACSS